MKIIYALILLLLLSKFLFAQDDCSCALSLGSLHPQYPDCSFGWITGRGEVCDGDSYSVEFIIHNLETGETSTPLFGGVGGTTTISLHGNQELQLFKLGNGRWTVNAKILNGKCVGRTANITVDFRKLEVCDGKDNDCIGGVDDGLTTRKYFKDEDHDGFGNSALYIIRCGPHGDFATSDSTDCNDNSISTHPGALEICGDGIDNNCNGLIDENVKTFYIDWDGDGIGSNVKMPCYRRMELIEDERGSRFVSVDIPITKTVCEKPLGYVDISGDCDDCDASVYPMNKGNLRGFFISNREICDGKDNDCDGRIDEGLSKKWYPDKDRDKFGDKKIKPLVLSCSSKVPKGMVNNNYDCNDNHFDPILKNEDCAIPDDPIKPSDENFGFAFNVRLRSFLPPEALRLSLPHIPHDTSSLHILPAYFSGDNREYFSYSEGTNRFMMDGLVVFNSEKEMKLELLGESYNFGVSKRYESDNCFHMEEKPDWFFGVYNPSDFEDSLRQKRTFENLRFEILNRPQLGYRSDYAGSLRLLCHATLPLVAGAAAIDAEIYIDIYFSLKNKTVKCEVNGKHDGFPAFELYVGENLLYFFSPVLANTSPWDLIPPPVGQTISIPTDIHHTFSSNN